MSNLSRLRYVVAANINALIEKAEDPEKLLRALIREMDDASEEARLACAELLAEQQHLEREEQCRINEGKRWHERAETAVSQGRDDLARDALRAGREIREGRDAIRDEQKRLAERITQMDADMTTLKGKLAEAKGKLRNLQESRSGRRQAPTARGKGTRAERKAHRAMDRFDRLQAQVDSLEARVRSYDLGGPVASPWKTPRAISADPEIEAELNRIKDRLSGLHRAEVRQEELQP